MKSILCLVLTLTSINAYSSDSRASLECFKAASNDPQISKLMGLKDIRRSKDIVVLCSGATSNAPIDCFHAAVSDSNITHYLNYKEIAALCSSGRIVIEE